MSLRVRSRVSGLILLIIMLAGMTIGIARAQQSNFVAPVLIVNTGNLNVRTGPGVNYPVLLVATGGTQFPVLGVARDLVWYQINTDAGVGWVNVEFMVARGDFTNVPFADAPALVNTTTNTTTVVNPVVNAPRLSIDSNRVIVNTGNLNVRSGPGAAYGIIAKIAGGVEMAIVGRAPDDVWFLVEGYFGLGWVNSQYVIFRGNYETVPIIEDAYRGGGIIVTTNLVPNVVVATSVPVPTAVPTQIGNAIAVLATVPPAPVVQDLGNHIIINTGNLNVRRGPGGSYEILAKVAGGTQLKILGRAPDDVWFLIEGYFGLGWVNSQYVIFRGDYRSVPIIEDAYRGGGIIVNVANTTTTTTNTITVTTTPQTVVITTTPQTVVVTPVPQTVIQPSANQGNRVIINTGNLNVRSGPGAGFSVVAVVPGGTELPVVGRAADGVWYLVQGGFGQGWINIEFAIFRGDGASVPVLDIRG